MAEKDENKHILVSSLLSTVPELLLHLSQLTCQTPLYHNQWKFTSGSIYNVSRKIKMLLRKKMNHPILTKKLVCFSFGQWDLNKILMRPARLWWESSKILVRISNISSMSGAHQTCSFQWNRQRHLRRSLWHSSSTAMEVKSMWKKVSRNLHIFITRSSIYSHFAQVERSSPFALQPRFFSVFASALPSLTLFDSSPLSLPLLLFISLPLCAVASAPLSLLCAPHNGFGCCCQNLIRSFGGICVGS